MKLKLNNFRCWSNAEFEFQDNVSTLLRGPSGVGKSTIFTAIYWVLYGEEQDLVPLAMQVDKKTKSKAVVSATLEIGDIIIHRQTNSNLLQVYKNGAVYIDKEAQGVINYYFGEHDLWVSSSIIRQNFRNTFVNASNSDKMSIIRRLVFGGTSADEDGPAVGIINQLEQIYNYENQQYLVASGGFNAKYANFQQRTMGIDWSLAMEEGVYRSTVDLKNMQLSNLRQQYQQLWDQYQERQKQIAVLQSVEQQYQSVNKDVEDLRALLCNDPTINNSELLADVEKVSKRDDRILDSFVATLQQVAIANHQLSGKLREGSPDIIIEASGLDLRSLEAEAVTVASKEKLASEGQYLAKSLGVEFTEEARQRAIDDIVQKLSIEPLIQLHHRISSLQQGTRQHERNIANIMSSITKHKAEIQNIGEEPKAPERTSLVLPPVLTEEQLNELRPIPQEPQSNLISLQDKLADLRQQLQHMVTAGKQLSCPSCESRLFFHDGHLTVDHIPDREQRINSLHAALRNVELELAEDRRRTDEYRRNVDQIKQQRAALVTQRNNEIYQLQQQHSNNERNTWMEYQRQHQAWKQRKDGAEVLIGQLQSEFIKESERLEINKHTITTELNGLKQHHNLDFDELSVVVEQSRNTINIAELKLLKSRLDNLRIVEVPSISSARYYQHIAYVKCKQQFDECMRTLTTHYGEFSGWTPERMQHARKIANDTINVRRQYQSKLPVLESIKSTLEAKRSELLPDSTDVMVKLNQEILDVNAYLTKLTQVNVLMNEYRQLQLEQQSIADWQRKLSEIQRMKNIALEQEALELQKRIDVLNYYISSVVSKLFDSPIMVKVKLTKKLKTRNIVRPCVNLGILYQGHEFDSISKLSGGEQDRASIGITIGLFLASRSKILILDECFPGLDPQLKQRAIEVIRDMTKDKTVLVVCHGNTGGFFDGFVNIHHHRELQMTGATGMRGYGN